MLNMAFVKVVNDQHLFKLLLGPLQTSFSCTTPLLGLKNIFKSIGSWSRIFFFFLEVSISTLDHQNLTPSLVDNKIENF